MSPTQRTTERLRDWKWRYDIVERWNPHVGEHGIRQDLFNVIDVVALNGREIVGIQSTSGSNHRARLQKSLAEPALRDWLKSGGAFEIWSWSLVRLTATNLKRWKLYRERITLGHLPRPREPFPEPINGPATVADQVTLFSPQE